MKEHKQYVAPDQFERIKHGLQSFYVWDPVFKTKVETGDRIFFEEYVPCVQCKGSGRVWGNGDTEDCGCAKPHGRVTGRTWRPEVIYIEELRQGNSVVLGLSPKESRWDEVVKESTQTLLGTKILFVVYGEDCEISIDPELTLMTAMQQALKNTHNTGRPPEDWEIRDETGKWCDPAADIKSFGWGRKVRLFLSLKVGFGG